MKEKSILELIQLINETTQRIDDILYKYHSLMYSEESNDVFDEEYDSLTYHLQGWEEEKYQNRHEMYSEGVTRKKLNRILNHLESDLEFAHELQGYYKSTQRILEKPKYIYG